MESLKNLSPVEKRETLKRMIASRAKPSISGELPARVPATLSQQRLWILSRLNPDSPAYNMMYAFQMEGRLHFPSLQKALDGVIERQDVLRCCFVEHAQGPGMIFQEPGPVTITREDLRHFHGDTLSETAHQRILEASLTTFDLEKAPLFRILLFDLDENRHILAVIMHHIITDNISYQIFTRELGKLYDAFRLGAPSPLAALPLKYREYAMAEQNHMSEQDVPGQVAYWKNQLSSLVVTELPPDKARPAVETHRGAVHSGNLPAQLAIRGRALAMENGLTEHMFFMATFMTLLFRHVDNPDINCGVPVANRSNSKLSNLMGFFTNTLVMRTNFDGTPSFREILARVRETCVGAMAHPHAPFEQLVKELAPERDLSRNPLYQIVFQVAMRIPLQLSGLNIQDAFLMDYGLVRCDLEFYLFTDEGGFSTLIVYNSDLYESSSMGRLIARFNRLLGAALEQPDMAVGNLSLLTPAESEALLVTWNNTQAAMVGVEGIHHVISRVAHRQPSCTAVVSEDDRLRYGELEDGANRLAHHLRALGARQGHLIGVCLPRGTAMVEALLAVLKCGAAYVPMDPSFPAQRLAMMLEDGDMYAVLASRSDEAALEGYPGHKLWLEELAPLLANCAAEDPDLRVDFDQTAYVIFTSGSTGRPKGVVIPHGALSNFLRSMAKSPGIQSEDVLIALTTLSFDIAALEIYLPLMAGARLIIASREQATDGAALARLIETYQATLVQGTPSTWRLLVESGWSGSGQLKILCGGEALPKDLARALISRSASLWNMYGPTETTIWSSVSRVTTPEEGEPFVVPIGHPIDNTNIYVLDHRGQLSPLGTPGELVIGGLGLARGYLDKPAMTAEKFVPDPFSGHSGARLYRTGDLVRFVISASGQPCSISFMGRSDNQIKLRGFRIELDDIASVLSGLDGIKQVIILAQQQEQHLLAYLLIEEGRTAPDPAQCRAHAYSHLPAYMVPAAYVPMQAFPLTPNGKIHRSALPKPLPEHYGRKEGMAHVLTALEEIVATIWADVLNKDCVEGADDFFQLGGHSLSVTRMLARLRETLGIETSMRTLFDASTLSGFCEKIDGLRSAKSGDFPPIMPISRDGMLPLSLAQKRLWFLEQLAPDNATYNMPFILDLKGLLSVDALEQSLAHIFRRHEVYRTSYPTLDDLPGVCIEAHWRPSLPLIDLSGQNAEQKERLGAHTASQEALRPFSLAVGPLLRFSLLRFDAYYHQLLVTVHHIISDAWSLSILIRELAIVYEALAQAREFPLSDPELQYLDFAAWQVANWKGPHLEKQLSWWQKNLEGAPALHRFPTDFPRPEVMTNNGAHHNFWMEAPLLAAARRISQEHGVTLHMTLLAAYLVLLFKYSGQDDICIGTTYANRNQRQLEPMMGFFVSTLVLRNNLNGDPSFSELLRRVRSVTLSAYENADPTFEQIVEVVKPERNPSYNLLFQLLFELQTVVVEPLEVKGLVLTPHEADHVTSKFDLSVSFRESSGRMLCFFEYNTDLFRKETIVQLEEKLLMLMEQLYEDSSQPLSAYSITSQAERSALANDFADDLY